MDPWIADSAQAIAATAARELEALVGVSSPSGDVRGAEEAVAVAAALLPPDARVERVPCSSPGHAPDLVARLAGTGSARLLLVGHVDTVVAHDAHSPCARDGDRLVGSGSIDMKGGDVLALGVLRALAGRRGDFAEVALLLVADEEWRTAPFGHVERFAGFDACLCFEAGQRDGDGRDAVVVKRKAAGTIRSRRPGARPTRAPPRTRRQRAARARRGRPGRRGAARARRPRHLTAVPTVVHAGDAFNVVPAAGELVCDVRADDLDAFDAVLAAIPAEVGGATLTAENLRCGPGWTRARPSRASWPGPSEALGRPIRPAGAAGRATRATSRRRSR